jgi:hypothetical protein
MRCFAVKSSRHWTRVPPRSNTWGKTLPIGRENLGSPGLRGGGLNCRPSPPPAWP